MRKLNYLLIFIISMLAVSPAFASLQEDMLYQLNTVNKLEIDPKIAKIAEQRCAEIDEWSHKGFQQTAKKVFRYNYKYVGENLARCFADATSTMQALENSPTHKDNNHNKNYQKVGIAVCDKWNTNLIVILFGGKYEKI